MQPYKTKDSKADILGRVYTLILTWPNPPVESQEGQGSYGPTNSLKTQGLEILEVQKLGQTAKGDQGADPSTTQASYVHESELDALLDY